MEQENMNRQETVNHPRPHINSPEFVNRSGSINSKEAKIDHENRRDTEKIELTAYEKMRAKNIERNQNRLASLGLVSEEEARKTIDIAWRKEPTAAATEAKQHARKKIISQKQRGSRIKPGFSGRNISTRGTRSSSANKEKFGGSSSRMAKDRGRKGKWKIPSKDHWISV